MLDQLFLFLSDFLMFTPENYLRMISSYNLASWPLAVLALLLASISLILIKSHYAHRDRLINLILACHWLSVGLVFHYHYFNDINWAAPAFALLFILQSILLVIFGVIKNNIQYQAPLTPIAYSGLFIYLFALLPYPGIIAYLHQGWDKADYYGVGADATCLATLGLLLMTSRRQYAYLVLPLLWCLLSATMAWLMAFKHAWLLLFIALITAVINVFPGHKREAFDK